MSYKEEIKNSFLKIIEIREENPDLPDEVITSLADGFAQNIANKIHTDLENARKPKTILAKDLTKNHLNRYAEVYIRNMLHVQANGLLKEYKHFESEYNTGGSYISDVQVTIGPTSYDLAPDQEITLY